MTNMNQKPEDAQKLHAEIKKTWSKLSDDDIKLAGTNRDQFFAKLHEKQAVSKADGEKKLQELEKACGCGPSCGTQKPDATKAA
jgi:hypothetical protein